MTYPVVRLDNIQSLTNGSLLRTIEFATKSGNTYTAAAVNNGCIALLDGLKTGEKEIFHAIVPAANSALSAVVLVAAPEYMTDERKHNLDDFTNAAGTLARGVLLQTNDIFSVTSNGFDVATGHTVAVGSIVELQADEKMNIVASLTSGSTKVGTIIAIETVGTYTYYVVQVA